MKQYAVQDSVYRLRAVVATTLVRANAAQVVKVVSIC